MTAPTARPVRDPRVWRVGRRWLPWRPGWGGFGDPIAIAPPKDISAREATAHRERVREITRGRPAKLWPMHVSTSWDSILVIPWALAVLAVAALGILWVAIEALVVVVVLAPAWALGRLLAARPWTVEAVANVPGYRDHFAEHWVWHARGARAATELVDRIRHALDAGGALPEHPVRRFVFRGTGLHRFWLDVEPDRVRLRSHVWGTFPRAAVLTAATDEGGTLRITLEPRCRCLVFGVPARRRGVTLRFLADPDGACRALLEREGKRVLGGPRAPLG